MVHKGKLKMIHIPGSEQAADVFTKQVLAQTARKHIHNLRL